jgi:uncharacterized membrane protein YhhN
MTTVRPSMRAATPWLFIVALIAGASFWPASHMDFLGKGALFVIWKTAGVALLAIWAALRARSAWGWLLAGVMTWGAIGDATLEMSQIVGGAAFLLGHLFAIALYRSRSRQGWGLPGLAAMAAVIGTAWLLTHRLGILVYATGLGGMLGAAIASRFPRNTVALGAAFFAVSDLLIFAQMSVLAHSVVPPLLIWPLYFAGQALIAWGAASTLQERPGREV